MDEFGSKYEITGPAIFKFEGGKLLPSLNLWVQIAKDAEVKERRAVLLWLTAKVPAKFRRYVEDLVKGGEARLASGGVNYAQLEEPEEMRAAALEDRKLPAALREFLGDEDLWTHFKPSGYEINLMRDLFGPLGEGRKDSYREALRLIREFSHSF